MIMVCQGRNIPLSFSSVELLFSTKSICVAIILCLSTLPSRAEAGEYFNPNLLEVAESPAASVDLSYFSQDGIPPGTYGRCEQVPDMRSCLSSGAMEQGSS